MATKKARRGRKRLRVPAPETYSPPKSLTVRIADNGFIIETYGRAQETIVANSSTAALRQVRSWLNANS